MQGMNNSPTRRPHSSSRSPLAGPHTVATAHATVKIQNATSEVDRTAVAYEGDRADEINALHEQFYSIIDRTDKENPAFHFCGEQIS